MGKSEYRVSLSSTTIGRGDDGFMVNPIEGSGLKDSLYGGVVHPLEVVGIHWVEVLTSTDLVSVRLINLGGRVLRY